LTPATTARVGWRIQELAFGGLPDAAKARMLVITPATLGRSQVLVGFIPDAGKAAPSPGKTPSRRHPRLPSPGSTIVRRYRAADVRVLVLDDGFEWDSHRFDSLRGRLRGDRLALVGTAVLRPHETEAGTVVVYAAHAAHLKG
jgi:hypothetical protein